MREISKPLKDVRLMTISFCKIVFTLVCGWGVLVQTAWAGPVLERIKKTGSITLGTREASVPFSFAQPGQKPVGYAVDICHLLVEAVRKKTGLKTIAVNHLPVTSATRIDAVVQGKVDLGCEATTNNAERRQKVMFTIPHYITGARYLIRADSGIKELRDFDGKKLVSTTGSRPLEAIVATKKERSLNITVLEAPDHNAAVDMVAKGEADGFVMDEVLLVAQIAARPDSDKLAVVGKYLIIDALGIMLPNTDPAFKLLIDSEMRRLIQTRELHALHDRWFVQPIFPNGKALNLPMNHILKDFWKYPTDWVPH
jgi:ABC-type amino acid transport substrate-binding protein